MLVSIRAIYNWDNTIFDNLVLPDEMDKQTLVDLLLIRLAELTVIYNQPDLLKTYIRLWSATRKPIWDRLWELANAEYNPLDNYDRTDTVNTTHGHKLTIDRANTVEGTSYGVDTNDDNSKDYVYGYNSSERTPTNEKEFDGTENYSNTMNKHEYGEDVHTNSGTDVEVTHGQGNIGVTTYQKMMTDEFEMRPKLDIYNYIIEEFKHEFCVVIY